MNVALQSFLVGAVLRIVGAVAIFLVGRWLARLGLRSVRIALLRIHATPSFRDIVERSVFYGLMLLTLFVALVVLGIPAEVLITIIGIVVIVAVVALRETLSDLAATLIFMIFQPFAIGDQIETNGVVGRVEEILLFNTVLITLLDNRKLIIPNSSIQNSNLINYSVLDKIRLDLPVSLSYSDDFDRAKAALLEIAHADARVLGEPAPVVDVMELGDSGVRGRVLRVYTQPDDFWALRPALTEQIKLEFQRQGLTIPFRQVDLHVNQTGRDHQGKPANDGGLLAG